MSAVIEAPQAANLKAQELELAAQVSEFYADPLGFAIFAFPWGRPGTALEHFNGPNSDQERFLGDLGDEIRYRRFDGHTPVEPIRMAVPSGHGTGKSALGGILNAFILSTRPRSHGTVTANTNDQLETKTWAAIQKWMKLCATRHWFETTSERMWYRGQKDDWFSFPTTCREENAEAFAGQHAIDSTSWYLFDEDSKIADLIHETAEGGLTDGESMIFLFGQVTRRTGRFYRVTNGAESSEKRVSDQRALWNIHQLNAEKSQFANQVQIRQWASTYGVDSDFYRVRVLGLPPQSDDVQYIDSPRVQDAQKRVVMSLPGDPLIAGTDVARGGKANNCVYFRCGLDARYVPPLTKPGLATRDTMVLVAWLAEILVAEYQTSSGRKKITMMFVDSGFGGAAVNRLNQMGFTNVQEINFGGDSPDSHFKNMRAYMFGQSKEWLMSGAILNNATKEGQRLEEGLTAPGFGHDDKNRVVIESKEDIVERNPDLDQLALDLTDAFILTHARKVPPLNLVTRHQMEGQVQPRSRAGAWG